MGIHSGPVKEADVNQRANIAGAGINMAQRVMDCGDAGHILLSKHVADDLEQNTRWRPYLHDLGECEVKHGVRIGLANLYDSEVGNSQASEEVRRRLRDIAPMCVGRQWRSGCWWCPRSPLWFLFFAQRTGSFARHCRGKKHRGASV